LKYQENLKTKLEFSLKQKGGNCKGLLRTSLRKIIKLSSGRGILDSKPGTHDTTQRIGFSLSEPF
jgi:hypothetical protein